ncbi:MAG TPA: hypothetical protein VHU22_11085 [Xanthobacteraceae bacterium]|nr:hypothetical protein [Xanthobacteraceae bacterium]
MHEDAHEEVREVTPSGPTPGDPASAGPEFGRGGRRRTIFARVAGIVASAAIVGAAIVAWKPSSAIGYVQINSVPVTPVTQTLLYFDTIRLAPLKNGSALLRQSVGTLTLRADSYGSSTVPLCQIEVRKDRITTVTVSMLERPPRCQCRFTSGGDPASHVCVS